MTDAKTSPDGDDGYQPDEVFNNQPLNYDTTEQRFLILHPFAGDKNDEEAVVRCSIETVPLADAKPFTLSVRAYLVYPPRSAPNAVCNVGAGDFAAGIPTSTAGGCLVELLEDMTPDPLPGGGTGLRGEWPAGVPK
jgi:hypothetical protein